MAAGPMARYWLASIGFGRFASGFRDTVTLLQIGFIFAAPLMMADSDQIVTHATQHVRKFFDAGPTSLIKPFDRALVATKWPLEAQLRLDGNTDEGDKARHGNVFCHLWHFDYRLASRWPGRFRLIFLSEWTNEPASQAEPRCAHFEPA